MSSSDTAVGRTTIVGALAAVLLFASSLTGSAAAAPDRFTRQMAKVGIGTYKLGSRKPIVRVNGPASPVRLTTAQAASAAAGARTHTGLTAGQLNTLTGRAAMGKLRMPTGALVVAWATAARTPSARLARRMLGPVTRSRYESVVLPNAALMLFASDVARHLPQTKRAARGATSPLPPAVAADLRPCTGTQEFIDNAVKRVFDAIGHIKPDRAQLNRIFGDFFGPILAQAGDLLVIPVNATIDAGRFIVVNAVRIPVRAVIEAIAGVAAVVTVVEKIANGILPWQGRITGPNPTRKGIGQGVPGQLSLKVSTLASNLEWPVWLRDCAQLFDFPLPTTTPRGEPVNWNLVQQAPAGLISPPLSGDGRLDDRGGATFDFVTGSEDPETAKGPERNGRVDVVTTVQRTDLDPLVRDLSKTVLRPIPDFARSLLTDPILAVLTPMIASVTNRILELRNVSTRAYLTVIYHDPPDDEPDLGPPVPHGLARVIYATAPGAPVLAEFTRATCAGGKDGHPFTLDAQTGDTRLRLSIGAWSGFGRTYTWSPGSTDPVVSVSGAAGRNWSTASVLPEPLWQFIAPLVGSTQSVNVSEDRVVEFRVQSLTSPADPDKVIYVRGSLGCA